MANYQATNACAWRDDSGGRWIPHITSDLRAGTYSGNTMVSAIVVDLAALRGTYATHYPTAARLRLTRTGAGSYGSDRTLTLYAGWQSGIPAVGNNSATPASRPSRVTGGHSYTISAGQTAKTLNIATAIIDAIGNSTANCVLLDNGTSTTNYMSFVGRGDLTKVVLEVDWAAREPAPTPPSGILTVSPLPVKTATATFDWGNASDVVFPSNQLYYEMQMSYNGGTGWSATYTSAQGISQYLLDIKAALGLAAGQYYYNTNCKFRVRTKTPLYNGQHYYSNWVTSGTFAIDYRIAPSAPSSISVDNAAPYEGQTVNITVGRPAQYNAYDGGGAVMDMWYQPQLADTSTPLLALSAPVTSASRVVPYTVGNLTTGGADRAAGLRARCFDAENQWGALGGTISFTIKRFRAPVAIITKIDRDSTSATVHVRVPDTGFGGTQSMAQIQKIQYQKDGGGWTDAPLSAWSGNNASFALTGLSENARYTVQVRAVNIAPAGTGLVNKTGAAYTMTALEYSPAAFIFRDEVTGVSGLACKSLSIGQDFSAPIAEGEGRINGYEIWHAGNLGKTVLWSGALASGSVSIPAMLGYRAYQVRIGAGSYPVYVLVLRSPSAYCYGVNFDTNDSIMVIFTLDSSGTLNIVRIKTMTHTPSGSHSALSDGTMTEIIGLW